MNFIPVNEPLLNGNEKKYLSECIDSGWISSEGPFVSEFEEKFAARHNRKYAISVSNGTAALQISLDLLDLNPGDEVILLEPLYDSYPPIVERSGAVPKYVSLQPPEWSLPLAELEAAFGPETKMILLNNPMNPARKSPTRKTSQAILLGALSLPLPLPLSQPMKNLSSLMRSPAPIVNHCRFGQRASLIRSRPNPHYPR